MLVSTKNRTKAHGNVIRSAGIWSYIKLASPQQAPITIMLP